jgi:hypothetical protein
MIGGINPKKLFPGTHQVTLDASGYYQINIDGTNYSYANGNGGGIALTKGVYDFQFPSTATTFVNNGSTYTQKLDVGPDFATSRNLPVSFYVDCSGHTSIGTYVSTVDISGTQLFQLPELSTSGYTYTNDELGIMIDISGVSGGFPVVQRSGGQSSPYFFNPVFSFDTAGAVVAIGDICMNVTTLVPSLGGWDPSDYISGTNLIVYDLSNTTAGAEFMDGFSIDLSNNQPADVDTAITKLRDLYPTQTIGGVVTCIPAYLGNVCITVLDEFNSISVFDRAFGWARWGVGQFIYEAPLTPTVAAGIVSDLCFNRPYDIYAPTQLDITPENNTDKTSIKALGFGDTASILDNRTAFVEEIFATTFGGKPELGDSVDKAATIDAEIFPFTASEKATIEAIRPLTGSVVIVNASIDKKDIEVAGVANNDIIFIHCPANNTGTTGGFTIKKNGQTQFTIDVNNNFTASAIGDINQNQIANTYNYTAVAAGVTVTDNNGAADTVLPVGTKITYGNRVLILGDGIDAALAGAGAAAAPICFKKGTQILTPEGYKNVELLAAGSLVSTKNGPTEITELISYIGKRDVVPLYCMKKDALKTNMPLNDLYMSGTHAFKFQEKWLHMGCAKHHNITTEIDEDDIPYYHIVTSDYFQHTLTAEGVEVETCFQDKEDGNIMLWSCKEDRCRPLKCKTATRADMFREKEKNALKKEFSLVNTKKYNIQQQKIENKIIWVYNKNKKMNVPTVCSEYDL